MGALKNDPGRVGVKESKISLDLWLIEGPASAFDALSPMFNKSRGVKV